MLKNENNLISIKNTYISFNKKVIKSFFLRIENTY